MINKERVTGSLNNLIASKVAKNRDAAGFEGVAYDIADAALVIYREKIAAGLRRAGIEFADNETIDSDAILRAVKVKTGIDLQSFDIEEIKTKVVSELSTDISERLGFDIDLKNGLQAGIDGAVAAAIKVGGGKLVSEGLRTRLRRLNLAKMAGLSIVDVDRVYAAKKQSDYRRRASRPVWVAR